MIKLTSSRLINFAFLNSISLLFIHYKSALNDQEPTNKRRYKYPCTVNTPIRFFIPSVTFNEGVPIESSTLNELLAPFSLKRSAIQIAFLRILGIHSVSLKELEEIGIAGHYLKAEHNHQEPRLTYSSEIIFRSTRELKDINVMFYFLPLNLSKVSLDELNLVKEVLGSFDQNQIKDLYLDLSNLSDAEIDAFARKFLGDVSGSQLDSFALQLKIAREKSKDYYDYAANSYIF